MRLIPHKRFSNPLLSKYVLITGLLFLAACSSGGQTTPPPTDSPQIVGKYNGSFVIANSNPFVNVKTTLTVDAAGNVSGITTSNAAGAEKGTIQGTIRGSTAISLDFNLQFEAPATGKYTMTGKGVYSSITKELGSSLTAKNPAGTYIGDAPLVITKE
jgi:hypothetical protein